MGRAEIRKSAKHKLYEKIYGILTVLIFGIGIGLRLFFGPLLFPIPDEVAWLIGGIVILTGLAIYGWWTSFWRKKYRGELVTEGLYKYMRHPHYSSIIVVMFWVSFLFQSLIILLFSIFTVFGLNQAAKEEEEHLIKTYGDAYKKYMKKVRWRFIPRVI